MESVHEGFPLICCRNLSRRFAATTGVEGLDIALPQGSVCAFLGPNGAGKSTTVKLLTGQLRPDSGEATVAGWDVVRSPQELKRCIGVLPDRLGLFDLLTVEEHLHMAGPIYGLSKIETESRTDELLHVLGLDSARYTYADHCSHGTRKKTALAMALLHNPRVLFLDEPFEGVDPMTSHIIRDLLASLAVRGVTVFFTSHSLSLAERIATHAILLQKGRVVWNQPTSALPATMEELYFDLIEAPNPQDLPWLGSHPS